MVSFPDFKDDYRRLIRYLSTQLRKLGVDVRLGKVATSELIQENKPDVVPLHAFTHMLPSGAQCSVP